MFLPERLSCTCRSSAGIVHRITPLRFLLQTYLTNTLSLLRLLQTYKTNEQSLFKIDSRWCRRRAHVPSVRCPTPSPCSSVTGQRQAGVEVMMTTFLPANEELNRQTHKLNSLNHCTWTHRSQNEHRERTQFSESAWWSFPTVPADCSVSQPAVIWRFGAASIGPPGVTDTQLPFEQLMHPIDSRRRSIIVICILVLNDGYYHSQSYIRHPRAASWLTTMEESQVLAMNCLNFNCTNTRLLLLLSTWSTGPQNMTHMLKKTLAGFLIDEIDQLHGNKLTLI